MDGGLTGYQLYWKRIARHLSLSDAAKQVGVRASELSAFERGGTHTLSDEQIATYVAYLESIPVEEAPDPPSPS
jgi:transcriptional regulator with XRE-family HTH domain